MNTTITVILSILSSSLVSTIITSVIQKNTEKESRNFEMKYKTYSKFINTIFSIDYFVFNKGKFDILSLDSQCSKIQLFGSKEVREKVYSINSKLDDLYKKLEKNPITISEKELKENIEEIISLRTDLLKHMRIDLNLQKENIFFKILDKFLPIKIIIQK